MSIGPLEIIGIITYTLMLFCSEGKAWMSARVAAASRGASSGKRLPSSTRWVLNSTDTMVDRYLSGNWQTQANTAVFCISKDVVSVGFTWMCNGVLVHLHRIRISAVVLEDQSDGGVVSGTEHWPQAAQRYSEVLLDT